MPIPLSDKDKAFIEEERKKKAVLVEHVRSLQSEHDKLQPGSLLECVGVGATLLPINLNALCCARVLTVLCPSGG